MLWLALKETTLQTFRSPALYAFVAPRIKAGWDTGAGAGIRGERAESAGMAGGAVPDKNGQGVRDSERPEFVVRGARRRGIYFAAGAESGDGEPADAGDSGRLAGNKI